MILPNQSPPVIHQRSSEGTMKHVLQSALLAFVFCAPCLSAEPLTNPPPWANNPDVVSLREYIEAKLCAQSERMSATATALEKRLEGMNEFRDAMSDQRTALENRLSENVSRAEYSSQHKLVEQQIAELREWRSQQEGKASVTSVYLAYGMAVASLMISAVGTFYGMRKTLPTPRRG